jgi:hypothetical protein
MVDLPRAMRLCWHCRCCIFRSGFMLVVYVLLGRGIFPLVALIGPCVCWSERWSLRPTVSDDSLTKLCTEVFLHYSLFVLWMLRNSRKARFCTSKFTIYSIANTTDSHMLWLLLITLWFVAFTFSIQTRLTERYSLQVRTALYPVQNYSSAKCEEECIELLPPGESSYT